ncbi:MAG: NAD(P)H-hydrate dehydratase [Planctomycetia bacterium]|nr:NAD(P)H-hydrate dehydratase [Planctomycetia bacterium]
MQTYIPSQETINLWRVTAYRERDGRRAEFWRSLPSLPVRPDTAHKGFFGTALLIGGSRGMSGAISLAGAASVVSGAGLTCLAVPEVIQETVAQFCPEYTTIPCECDDHGRLLSLQTDEMPAIFERARSVGVGPGMGVSDNIKSLVETSFCALDYSMVFDADALNALALLNPDEAPSYVYGTRVLTPHPGEFARLTGKKPGECPTERLEMTRDYVTSLAEKLLASEKSVMPEGKEIVVALKGHETTIVAARKNTSGYDVLTCTNLTGNSNLATGGSGDVLTGLITGLMAQGASGWDATRIGCALHGLAAELRSTLVSRGATASDIIRFLPCAFDYYQHAWLACRELER